MSKKIDIERGGEVKLGNGKRLKVKPHSNRVYLTYWLENGAVIESLVYTERQPDSVDSDRIHLFVKPGDGKRVGLLMNIEDADEIILALATAIVKAKSLGVPRNG
jgi:hypothetical protein